MCYVPPTAQGKQACRVGPGNTQDRPKVVEALRHAAGGRRHCRSPAAPAHSGPAPAPPATARPSCTGGGPRWGLDGLEIHLGLRVVPDLVLAWGWFLLLITTSGLKLVALTGVGGFDVGARV